MVVQSSEPSACRATPLDEWHRRQGARLVDFAGWRLPMQYRGLLSEHKACRESSALFDVSHMRQLRVERRFLPLLSRLVPIDWESLESGQARYSFFPSVRGGVVDDLIVARSDMLREDANPDAESSDFLLVVNAAREHADFDHLRSHGIDFTVGVAGEDLALLALQGPRAAALLACGLDKADSERLQSLRFMRLDFARVFGVACRVFRGGYTGEDGFELACRAARCSHLASSLVEVGAEPAGLGARDSLRQEAGLCLYGNELDEDMSPIAAGLKWTLSPVRLASGDFINAAQLKRDVDHGCARLLVGFKVDSRAPVRPPASIFTREGQEVGFISSGGFSPSLDKPIAMGYLDASCHESNLWLERRAKREPATRCPLPFLPHRYARPLRRA